MAKFETNLSALLKERAELRRLFGELQVYRFRAERDGIADTIGAIAEFVLEPLDLDIRKKPGAPFFVDEVERALDALAASKYFENPSEYLRTSWGAERWSDELRLRVTSLAAQLDPIVLQLLEAT